MSQATNPAQLGAAAANITRFYQYRFISHFQLWMPIWILYLQDSRGISLAQILMLDAAFEIMMLLAEVPTGVVADRWGRRRAMVLGQVGVTVAVVMFAFAPNVWAVLACYFVWAISGALTSGSDVAFVHDSLEAQKRPGEFGKVVARGNAAQLAGMGASSMIGAPIAAWTSLEFTVMLSIACAVVAVPIVWRFHDPGTHKASADARYTALLGTAARRVLRHPRLRALIIMQAVVSGFAWSCMLLTQPYLNEGGLPLAWFGVVLAGMHLIAFAASMLGPRVAGISGRQVIFFATPPIIVVSLLTMGLAPLWTGLVMLMVLRIALNFFGPLIVEQINRESVDEVRATIASMGTMCISVVGAGVKPLMGWSADANGLGSAYIVAAVGLAIFGGAALLAWAHVSRGSKPGRQRPISGIEEAAAS